MMDPTMQEAERQVETARFIISIAEFDSAGIYYRANLAIPSASHEHTE